MLKKITLLIGILWFGLNSNSQVISFDNASKELLALFEKAYVSMKNGQYNAALTSLNTVIQKEPNFIDAYLAKADVYQSLKKYALAIDELNLAYKLDSTVRPVNSLREAVCAMGIGNFDAAAQSIALYKNGNKNIGPKTMAAVERMERSCNFALQKSKANLSYKFDPINLGASINSEMLEYFPSQTIDNKTFLFTRRVGSHEDVYQSNLQNSEWTKAVALSSNTPKNEAAQSISQDGTMLVFAACDYPQGLGSCDIYICYKTPEGWSPPENLGPLVNTENWESSPCLSPDKQTLYFASTRSGGFGGKDIWAVHKTANGKWGDLENLGEAINTDLNEEGCFMHADNVSFYFTSDGKLGYGGRDIFLSKKVGDSAWVEAENLGYPINTIDDEGTLFVAGNGTTAYFNTDRSGSLGGLDIYKFELPKASSASKALWIKGRVLDAKTKQPLFARIVVAKIDAQQKSQFTSEEDGYFFCTITSGTQYVFNINKKGYLLFSENVDTESKKDSVYEKDFLLLPIEKGAAVILKNIFFDTKKSVLKTASFLELEKLLLLLQENPTLKISINGHTDNVGKAADNLKLSQQRATAVVAYLIKKGINKARLISKGFGATKPIAPNTTDDGKAQNRRTEIIVESK